MSKNKKSDNKVLHYCKNCADSYCYNCSNHEGWEDFCSPECVEEYERILPEESGDVKK